ncbi:MAG TPA: HD domain-containing protein [Thermoplasmata archaeon]|nr:HD domain-containing protein [Thermoplasmata archaeon]
MPPRVHRAGTRKAIFDPVHGQIALDALALDLIGTAEFQRLWGIRQTGLAHLVFPGANHTRLEHSLGTYWVAGRFAEQLGLSPEERQRVAVGALLHDLGHGPFSHTLDGPMQEVLGHPHEVESRRRIEGRGDPESEIPDILRQHGLDPRSVADLIDAPPRRPAGFLGRILHGAIDADRVDYLQRDAHYTGVAHGAIDAVRLLDTVRVVGGELVFAEKGRSAVEGFLVGRALMYSTVYFHKTVRAAEMMAQAAVERSDGYPESAPPIFRWTDGELLVRLKDAGGLSATLTRALSARRLYKRAFGWRELSEPARGRWRRLGAEPRARRALEDALASQLGAPPGSVLLDLSGVEVRGDPSEDWAGVGLLAGRRVTHPFRGDGMWRALVDRPSADWPVSVYVAPRFRGRAARLWERDPPALP